MSRNSFSNRCDVYILCGKLRLCARQMDKPDTGVDIVNLGSNGKVGYDDVPGSSSALPFDQLHMVSGASKLQQEIHC